MFSTKEFGQRVSNLRKVRNLTQDELAYQHKGAEPEIQHDDEPNVECGTGAVDAKAAAALTKLLSDPSMAALIKNLAKSL